MAIKRLALLGAAEGPWIDVSRVQNPTVRVRGLTAGEVRGIVKKGKETQEITFNADGEVFLTTGVEWIKLTATKPTRSLVCDVFNCKVA